MGGGGRIVGRRERKKKNLRIFIKFYSTKDITVFLGYVFPYNSFSVFGWMKRRLRKRRSRSSGSRRRRTSRKGRRNNTCWLLGHVLSQYLKSYAFFVQVLPTCWWRGWWWPLTDSCPSPIRSSSFWRRIFSTSSPSTREYPHTFSSLEIKLPSWAIQV